MANAKRVDVGERAKQLIHVELDERHGHLLTLSHVEACYFGDRVRDVFQNQVEINIFLRLQANRHNQIRYFCNITIIKTYILVGIKVELESDNVAVIE